MIHHIFNAFIYNQYIFTFSKYLINFLINNVRSRHLVKHSLGPSWTLLSLELTGLSLMGAQKTEPIRWSVISQLCHNHQAICYLLLYKEKMK